LPTTSLPRHRGSYRQRVAPHSGPSRPSRPPRARARRSGVRVKSIGARCSSTWARIVVQRLSARRADYSVPSAVATRRSGSVEQSGGAASVRALDPSCSSSSEKKPRVLIGNGVRGYGPRSRWACAVRRRSPRPATRTARVGLPARAVVRLRKYWQLRGVAQTYLGRGPRDRLDIVRNQEGDRHRRAGREPRRLQELLAVPSAAAWRDALNGPRLRTRAVHTRWSTLRNPALLTIARHSPDRHAISSTVRVHRTALARGASSAATRRVAHGPASRDGPGRYWADGPRPALERVARAPGPSLLARRARRRRSRSRGRAGSTRAARARVSSSRP